MPWPRSARRQPPGSRITETKRTMKKLVPRGSEDHQGTNRPRMTLVTKAAVIAIGYYYSSLALTCPFAHPPAATLQAKPFRGNSRQIPKSITLLPVLFLATLPKAGNKDPCFTLFRVHITSDLTSPDGAAVSLLRAFRSFHNEQ